MKYIVIGIALLFGSTSFMKTAQAAEPATAPATAPDAAASAPNVVGGTTLGVSVAVVQALAYGWSVRKDALGKPVYNEQNQKIGKVDDIIISPNDSLSYAIIGTGGFLGIARHDVAIRAQQMKIEKGKILLPGATKASLKAMPAFEYAPKKAE